jgi:hypothetical protein
MDKGPQDHFTGSHYVARHATGPVAFMNPTKRYLPVHQHRSEGSGEAGGSSGDARTGSSPSQESGADTDGPAKPAQPGSSGGAKPARDEDTGVYHVWRSRDNRKGRHSAVVSPAAAEKAKAAGSDAPLRTNSWGETWKGIGRMFVRYPVWDVSYDVATVFTLGGCARPGLPLRDPPWRLDDRRLTSSPLGSPSLRRLSHMGHQRLL